MTIIYNKQSVQQFRRSLRDKSTLGEKLLWMCLRRKQIQGQRFLRQFSVEKYVLDFYCPELKLAIEIDGPTHFESDAAVQYDKFRQKEIESLGIEFLRFTDDDVKENIEGVIKIITEVVKQKK